MAAGARHQVAARRAPRARRAAGEAYRSPPCYLHEFDTVPETSAATPLGARARHAEADVRIKRVYEAADPADGWRVLVDRLWPRGVSRQRAALDEWLRELAPSTALRQWFHRDPRQWRQFARRYRAELRQLAPALAALRRRAAQGRVTLLYAARDPRRNHAQLLCALLRKP
jgi:uncharacterized protein YeaO (DUF488 family)